MISHYTVIDCFVLASGPEESFGNAVVEAMFLKIPSIVMSDSPGLKEHIIDNKTGFIASDIQDLSCKMEYVYSHRKECNDIAKYASNHVRKKYSIQNMKKAYLELYKDIIHE